jgi:lipase
MSAADYERLTVPVDGGDLTVGAWGDELSPVLLAVHGITATHLSLAVLAAALPECRVLAPDLRGRGRSSGLPGPWGMARHAADVAAVVESVGGPVAVAGHSMGGFVSVELARTRPDLVAGLVLVDGGLPLRLPPGVDLQTAAAAGLGPAMQRLRMTFPTRAAYLDFWRPHPALSADWSEAIEAYLDYDLMGTEPNLHSSVVVDAVLQDFGEQFAPPPGGNLLGAYSGPARILVVDKGLLGQPPGIYPSEELARWADAVPSLHIERVPDLNHYTLVLRPDGAERVAAAIRSVRQAAG